MVPSLRRGGEICADAPLDSLTTKVKLGKVHPLGIVAQVVIYKSIASPRILFSVISRTFAGRFFFTTCLGL